MNMPTAEQHRRGLKVSEEMFDASINNALAQTQDLNRFEFSEILSLYLRGDIDSVTGIYLAMTT